MLSSSHLSKKRTEDVCFTERLSPVSLAFIGQVTEHTAVEWPIDGHRLGGLK